MIAPHSDLLLMMQDPTRSYQQREQAWERYEIASWADAVRSHRLRICDLEERLREAVRSYLKLEGGYR